MSDVAIKFENISKQYRLGEIGTGTLSHDLKREKLKVKRLVFRVYRSGFRHSATLNPEPETRNPKPGTRNSKLVTRAWALRTLR